MLLYFQSSGVVCNLLSFSCPLNLKQGIQEFHRKYVLVPADKAANNVVVVCQLHYINTLKQELNGTKAYEETSKDEKSVVYSHLRRYAANNWQISTSCFYILLNNS